jgi:predicted kinase
MLVIMRGLAGSGKSTLAKQIAKKIGAKICSADYFFTNNQTDYKFNRNWLPVAHLTCQMDVYKGLRDLSETEESIIVDNTNILLQHMQIYEALADYWFSSPIRYIIPNTPWAFDPIECHKRCTHGVPLETIERMARQFEKHPKDEVGWS